MKKFRLEDIVPGVVVFARDDTFPWWPAIVGRCPETLQWRGGQSRTWVFFFNDDNGAWLKIKDMRPFAETDQQALTDINRLNPKHQKYLERIDGACQLANEYKSQPSGRRPLSEYNSKLTSAALEMTPPPPIDSGCMTIPNVSSVDQTIDGRHLDERSTNKSLLASITENITNSANQAEESGTTSTENVVIAPILAQVGTKRDASETGLNIAGRPRRKRKKTSRYGDFIDPSEYSGDGEHVSDPNGTKTVLPLVQTPHVEGFKICGSCSGSQGGTNLLPTVDFENKAISRRPDSKKEFEDSSRGGALNIYAEYEVMLPMNNPEEPTNNPPIAPAPTMPAETDMNPSIDGDNLPRSNRSDGKNGKGHGVEAEIGKGGARGATINLQAPSQVHVELDHGHAKASSATERETPHQTGPLTGRGGMVAAETAGAEPSAKGCRSHRKTCRAPRMWRRSAGYRIGCLRSKARCSRRKSRIGQPVMQTSRKIHS